MTVDFGFGLITCQRYPGDSRSDTELYRPQHLLATIMHTLFDVGQLRLEQNVPREIVRLTEQARPIDHLL